MCDDLYELIIIIFIIIFGGMNSWVFYRNFCYWCVCSLIIYMLFNWFVFVFLIVICNKIMILFVNWNWYSKV